MKNVWVAFDTAISHLAAKFQNQVVTFQEPASESELRLRHSGIPIKFCGRQYLRNGPKLYIVLSELVTGRFGQIEQTAIYTLILNILEIYVCIVRVNSFFNTNL